MKMTFKMKMTPYYEDDLKLRKVSKIKIFEEDPCSNNYEQWVKVCSKMSLLISLNFLWRKNSEKSIYNILKSAQ